MLEIRLAKISDYEKIKELYYSVIDDMKDTLYDLGWEKDLYPSNQYIQQSIEDNQLYIGIDNEKIVSTMILNHHNNEEYKDVEWLVEASQEEVIVIHTLAVSPLFRSKGIAEKMVKDAIRLAEEKRYKALRLDVLKGNLPAMKLYEKVGFNHIDTRKVDVGDYLDFLIYELEL